MPHAPPSEATWTSNLRRGRPAERIGRYRPLVQPRSYSLHQQRTKELAASVPTSGPTPSAASARATPSPSPVHPRKKLREAQPRRSRTQAPPPTTSALHQQLHHQHQHQHLPPPPPPPAAAASSSARPSQHLKPFLCGVPTPSPAVSAAASAAATPQPSPASPRRRGASPQPLQHRSRPRTGSPPSPRSGGVSPRRRVPPPPPPAPRLADELKTDELWVPVAVQDGLVRVSGSGGSGDAVAFCDRCSDVVLARWASRSWVDRPQQRARARQEVLLIGERARAIRADLRARRTAAAPSFVASSSASAYYAPTAGGEAAAATAAVEELSALLQRQAELVEGFGEEAADAREALAEVRGSGSVRDAASERLQRQVVSLQREVERLRADARSRASPTTASPSVASVTDDLGRLTPAADVAPVVPAAAAAATSPVARPFQEAPLPEQLRHLSAVMESTLADACRPADVDVVRKMLAAARASAAKMATMGRAAQQQQQQQQRGRAADLPQPAQCRPRSQERAALPPPPTVVPPPPPPPPAAVAAATPVEQQRDAEGRLRDGHGSMRAVPAEAEEEEEEALQVRVSCVYDLMTAKCGELGRTSAELIGDVSGASQASILLDQLEFLPDGSVDRSEWCDWFGALHSIGQSPDSILDVLLDEFRRLPRGRSNSGRGSGVEAPEPSLQTPVPVPRWVWMQPRRA